MKIIKSVQMLDLQVDVELSTHYKTMFNHEYKMCYDNSFQLLLHGEIDKYIIGWASTDCATGFPFRHGFGIKDGKIIDSTLRTELLKDTKYFTMLELTLDDVTSLFEEFESKDEEMTTSLDGYIGYNNENQLQVEIMKYLGLLK